MKTVLISLLLAVLVFGANGNECPTIAAVKWGQVSCTNHEWSGSVCMLSCEEHYDLAGTTEDSIETTCGEDGMWSMPTEYLCVPIRCQPPFQPPANGDLICSATNLAESLCVFFCDEHYDMRDIDNDRTSYAVCKDDGNGDEFGVWSKVKDDVPFPPSYPPVCDAVSCEPEMEAPENGNVLCSNDNNSGSTCVFYCNQGYRFEGMNSPVVFSTCQDDEDFDRFGFWTVSDIPKCERFSAEPNCGSPPSIDGVEFECDNDKYAPGTVCEASCASDTEKVEGDHSITCNDDKRWEATVMPSCVACKPLKPVELVAIVHESENRDDQYSIAVRMISKTITVLQRKYRLRPIVKVNRYSVDVDLSTEFATSMFDANEDRETIEAIPFPGNFEDIDNALSYVDERLTGKATTQVALILMNRMVSFGPEAEKKAEKLREQGVTIIAVAIPQRNRALTWRRQDLETVTGDPALVHFVGSIKQAERLKTVIGRQIYEAAVNRGCDMDIKA